MFIPIKYLLGLGLVICILTPTLAQKKDKKNKKGKKEENLLVLDERLLERDSIPNLTLEMSEEELNLAQEEENQRKKKKKKKKKKIYFGMKTSGGFTKKVTSSYVDLRLFRYIDSDHVMKDPYQKEIHYFDPKSKKIKTINYHDFVAQKKKGRSMMLLHGQYRRFRSKKMREEGFFYKGMKHGKWVEYDKRGVVLEKVKYDLGFPEESKIVYYDAGQKKVKEIIPIMHGRIQGTYYKFHENGATEIQGKYENNKPVGLWRHWFETRQRYQHVMHPTKWWDEAEPVKLREWNKKGRMVYDIDRGGEVKR